MRIAFVSHLSEVSGATVALVETADAFAKAGHDVVVIFPGNGPIVARALQRGLRAEILENPQTGISDSSIRKKVHIGLARLGYIRRLRQLLVRESIDVAYVNSSASIFPGIAAKLARIPVVWHVHESLIHDDKSTRLKKKFIPKLASGLLFASESGRRLLPPGGMPSLIVRNKVALNDLQDVRTRRQQSSQGFHKDVLLLSNGVYTLKGADILLDAATILERSVLSQTITISVVGSLEADPEYYINLRRQADQLDSINVEFPGLQNSLLSYYEKATIYVSASRNEAMPIAIVEAMAAGVPVIATAVGDCADLLDNGRCGWIVSPEDPNALAAVIMDAVSNPDEAASRAASAAEKVDRLYGGDDFWQPLMEFVGQVARK